MFQNNDHTFNEKKKTTAIQFNISCVQQKISTTMNSLKYARTLRGLQKSTTVHVQ